MNGLISTYWTLAPQSLLFIPVRSIIAWDRSKSGFIRKKWSTHSNCSTTDIGENRHSRLSLTLQHGSAYEYLQNWHIASRTIPFADIPLRFQHFSKKHQLRSVSVSVAAPITNLPTTGKTRSQFRLYSKLPLPTFTSLSTHVDASWILAEDRRSIRFDESGQVNLESQYNRWLLTDCLPDVYGAFLASWPELDRSALWPGYSSATEDITRSFVQAFFKDYLSKSNWAMFTSAPGPRLTFSQSVFLRPADQLELEPLIKVLKPKETVTISSRLFDKLPSTSRCIDANFMREAVLNSQAAFHSAYSEGSLTLQDIHAFLKWMLSHSPPALHGLQVLPLADKTFARVQPAAAQNSLILAGVDPARPPWPPFPKNRFLEPTLNGDIFFGRDLNIHKFSGTHVATLLQDMLPKASRRTLSAQEASLVTAFWETFDVLPATISDVSDFPLIRITHLSNDFISFKHCQSGSVLFLQANRSLEPWLTPMLEKLGATILNYSTVQSILPLHALKQLASLGSSFIDIVRFLRTLGTAEISSKMKRILSAEELSQFAIFARGEIETLKKVETVRTGKKKKKSTIVVTIEESDVCQQLPIWPAYNSGKDILVQANDRMLRMLPSSLYLCDARGYLAPSLSFVDHDSTLEILSSIQAVTLSDMSNFHFPSHIEENDIPVFRKVLLAILDAPTLFSVSSLKAALTVPNQNLVFVNASTLYAHAVQLFRQALINRPSYFPHDGLRFLEPNLVRMGLHNSIDFDSFKLCAQTVAEDLLMHPAGSEARARAVFDYYNGELWLRIGSDTSKWQELDGISFVPRSTIRRNYSESSPSFIPLQWTASLPDIVSPSQLLRPDCESVAWTQRGLFPVVPSPNLLLAHPTLGVPSANEVVSDWNIPTTSEMLIRTGLYRLNTCANYALLHKNILSTSVSLRTSLKHTSGYKPISARPRHH